MIYIAICEDDQNSLEILKKNVTRYIKENNILANITAYQKSKLLKYDIQDGKYYDLILSDIKMPEIDGIELVSYIKKYLPNSLIIFITSYLKYAVDAFELSVFRYIPKNSIAKRLPHALEDAIHLISLQADDYFVIETQTKIEKILYKKIIYIQKEGKNSIIVLSDGTTTKIRKSLTQLYNELKQDMFTYIERGTIVNLIHILSLNNGIIKLDNGHILHSSRLKFEETKSKLSEFWGNNL